MIRQIFKVVPPISEKEISERDCQGLLRFPRGPSILQERARMGQRDRHHRGGAVPHVDAEG